MSSFGAKSAQQVPSELIKEAVAGRELDVLADLGVPWPGASSHIRCPYPGHDDENPSWRWDADKERAYCTCPSPNGRSHDIFAVVMRKEGIDFRAAKILVAEAINRNDLIQELRTGIKSDAKSLLNPPTDLRDDALPQAYLAHRLEMEPADVLMPSTRCVGIKRLAYWVPPQQQGGNPEHIGDHPCAVFETKGLKGQWHALRIYLAPDGTGKADLGRGPNGSRRDPKKSAKKRKGQKTAGLSVSWGDPTKAPHIIISEGIETGAAIAQVFRPEIKDGSVAVAATISAAGMRAFTPRPETKTVTVAADRDEEDDRSKNGKAGEKAARAFAAKHHESVDVRIALPGKPGRKIDWLDVFLSDGAESVRHGILDATPFAPSAEDKSKAKRIAGDPSELARMEQDYPLPTLTKRTLGYLFVDDGRALVHAICKSKDGEDVTPVSTPFSVPARLRFADREDAHGLRVTVMAMDKTRRALDIDMGELIRGNANDVREKLLRAGLRVEPGGERIVVDALKAVHPTQEIVVVTRPGWHWIDNASEPVFITPAGAMIGTEGAPALELAHKGAGNILVPKGTFESWRDAIDAAIQAENCPHWRLGVLVAFVGVLASLCDLETQGINLSGASSRGKTTAQKLAASAWSTPLPGRGLLQTLRTTENAVEALAEAGNGTALLLDELGHVEGHVVGRLIYSLSSSKGKSRMNANAELRESYEWSTFVLTSAEHPLREKVQMAGETWTAGMAARFADISVDQVNAKVGAEVFERMAGIDRNYGHAGPMFVRALIEDGVHRDPQKLLASIGAVTQKLSGEDALGTKVRIAKPFALLSVACDLAIHYGVLPDHTGFHEAVLWAWTQYGQSSAAEALNVQDRAVQGLRLYMQTQWDVTVQHVDARPGGTGDERKPNREAVAWYDDHSIYVPPKHLGDIVQGAMTPQALGRYLDKKGFLTRRGGERRIALDNVPGLGKGQYYALKRSEFGRRQGGGGPDDAA